MRSTLELKEWIRLHPASRRNTIIQQEKKTTRPDTSIPISFSQGGSRVVDVIVAPESLPSTQQLHITVEKSQKLGEAAAKAMQYRLPTWGTVLPPSLHHI